LRKHAGIDVVCVTSSEIANLTRREADLAIRTLRPESPDLIVRRLGHLETGIYASRGYLAERGEPLPGSAFEGHDLVMYQQPIVPTMWEALCGEPTSRGRVMFQTSSTMMLVEATLAGLGVWLVAHADLYKTARVQAVIEAVVDEFASAAPAAR